MKYLPKITKSETSNESGSAVPYIFGWLMGVPVSVLFLIFMFRSCAA